MPNASGNGAEGSQKNAPAELTVLVDDKCAVENITRFASNAGYEVSVEKEGTDYRLTLKK